MMYLQQLKRILLSMMIGVAVITTATLAQNYDEKAKIESRREDRLLTLLFDNTPEQDHYFIIENAVSIGTITILGIDKNYRSADRVRVYARYELYDLKFDSLMRAGLSIGLRKKKEKKERDYSEKKYMEIIHYRARIITAVDNREMILIPRGKFIFGSDRGRKDESPEHIAEAGDFYIDKYEVSNQDYYRYIQATGSPPPDNWINGEPDEKQADLPVIVSFREAERYARWANKRLPTELEWEKAARGEGFTYVVKDRTRVEMVKKPLDYPWGNVFKNDQCNSMEFWKDPVVGQEIKKHYSQGLLPVTMFEKESTSPYGVVNMAGNAQEWTTDWYTPYEGNRYRDIRYGKQLKVLRGGSWMVSAGEVRTTRRALGGIPNLYKDRIGGIRCVKFPTVLDRVSGAYQDNKNR